MGAEINVELALILATEIWKISTYYESKANSSRPAMGVGRLRLL